MARPEFIASLAVLSILGIFISAYLVKNRIKRRIVVCPIDGCEKVLESKWNHILGIKNDVMGLFYYTLILLATLYLFFISDNILFFTKIIEGVALLFSAILTFIQIKIIKEYCFYCFVSALINLLIFVNVFFIV